MRSQNEAVSSNIDHNGGHNVVTLNVGGVHFTTSQATLARIPQTFFTKIIDSKFAIEKDQNGCIYIDRNPDIFKHILDYLRNPTGFRAKIASLSPLERIYLLEDATYYQLEDLRKMILEWKHVRSYNFPSKITTCREIPNDDVQFEFESMNMSIILHPNKEDGCLSNKRVVKWTMQHSDHDIVLPDSRIVIYKNGLEVYRDYRLEKYIPKFLENHKKCLIHATQDSNIIMIETPEEWSFFNISDGKENHISVLGASYCVNPPFVLLNRKDDVYLYTIDLEIMDLKLIRMFRSSIVFQPVIYEARRKYFILNVDQILFLDLDQNIFHLTHDFGASLSTLILKPCYRIHDAICYDSESVIYAFQEETIPKDPKVSNFDYLVTKFYYWNYVRNTNVELHWCCGSDPSESFKVGFEVSISQLVKLCDGSVLVIAGNNAHHFQWQ